MKTSLFALAVLVLSTPVTCLAQSAIDGTWKVDLDSYSRGLKPASFEVRDGRFACVSCPGKSSIATDGRDHPVEGDRMLDTLAVKLLDARTVQTIAKKDGKVTSRTTLKISADGQTLVRQSTETINDHRSNAETSYMRVATGPTGSHWLSGSWRRVKVGSVSEPTVTFRTEGRTLSMSSPHGGSYIAQIDGPPAPLKGDRSGDAVTVKMKDASTLEEIALRDGKPYLVTTMRVDPNGKTARVSWSSPQARAWEMRYMFVPDSKGETGSYTMTRQ